jgi:endoglucanase
MTRLALAIMLVSTLLAAFAGGGASPEAATISASRTTISAPPNGLRVSGNRLVDSNGNLVHLHGVNRSGTEYACIQGWGIFDGPSDAKSVRAMAAWHVNVVRIPLNEDCWLDINGVKRAYAGRNYRRAVVDYVHLLHKHGMYAELSLIWAAPGAYRATYQSGSPDADHSPAFWSSLASTFKDDPNVVLAPWGETVVNADCFLKGGVCEATFGPNNTPYETAGMQQAVGVFRKAGYRGVIAIPGVNYANDLSKWLSHKPVDPRHQLIAEAHVYGKNICDTTSCFDETLAPVAKRVPLIFGETGQTYDASDCGSSNISRFLDWADAHRVGYETWAWDTWGNCSALISDYDGTPRSDYGSWVRAHYAEVAAALDSGTIVRTRKTRLGTILVDRKGRTLYMFDKDRRGKSACSNRCASVWPPLVAAGRPRARGDTQASLLGTTRRGDRRVQVTYRRHPLYRFARDTKAGRARGQQVSSFGGTWFAVSPKGIRVERR